MFEFEWLWVWLALPLPYLIYRYITPAQPRSEAALQIPFYHILSDMTSGQTVATTSTRRLPWVIPSLIWVLLLGAASRPTWLGEPIELATNGRDLMMAVDLSGSMEIEDMVVQGRKTNRLTATKAVMDDFIARREGDRLGLILFGDQAYLQAPLTFDRATVKTLLQESAIGLAGTNTAIGDALGLAVKQLRKRPSDQRVLILLTDGANTAGAISPQQAASIAAKEGIRIYTIGLGADVMEQRTLFGTRRINPSADLDEKSLRSMADMTGGQYFRARNIEELNKIYAALDKLEPIEQAQERFRPSKNLFFWPLGLAMLLSLLLAAVRCSTQRGGQS